MQDEIRLRYCVRKVQGSESIGESLAHPCPLPRLMIEEHIAALFRLGANGDGFAITLVFS